MRTSQASSKLTYRQHWTKVYIQKIITMNIYIIFIYICMQIELLIAIQLLSFKLSYVMHFYQFTRISIQLVTPLFNTNFNRLPNSFTYSYTIFYFQAIFTFYDILLVVFYHFIHGKQKSDRYIRKSSRQSRCFKESKA